jgi:hypothetical protein
MMAIPLGSISVGMIFDTAAVPIDQLNSASEQCPNALVRLGTASMGFGIALPIANWAVGATAKGEGVWPMIDIAKRLFVGIKISKALQNDLDSPAPGTKHYFEGTDNKDFLQIINLGENKFIGRYVKDGFPAAAIADVIRNICSIVKLITRGRRIEEGEVYIYTSWVGVRQLTLTPSEWALIRHFKTSQSF